LLFDVLPDDADGLTATATGEVGRRPQGVAPSFFGCRGSFSCAACGRIRPWSCCVHTRHHRAIPSVLSRHFM